MTADYKSEFQRKANDIIERTRKGLLPREERMEEIEKITSEYAIKHAEAKMAAIEKEKRAAKREGRKPKELPFNPLDSKLLDALADAILHEELTDPHPDKITRNEYPIMSEFQLARRKEGVHAAKGKFPKGEIPLNAVSLLATDGKTYRKPKRAKRTDKEYMQMDSAKSRNKERRRKYNEFTKPQPVITYRLEDVQNGDQNHATDRQTDV
jgi:hypothetical protein